MVSSRHTRKCLCLGRALAVGVVLFWIAGCGTPSGNSAGGGALASGGSIGPSASANGGTAGPNTGGAGTAGASASTNGGTASPNTGGAGTAGASITGAATAGTGTAGAATAGTSQGGSGGGVAGAASGGSPGGGGMMGGAGGESMGGASGESTGGASEGGGGSGAAGADSGGPCPATATLMAGDSAHSLTVGGNMYPMNVHAPPSYDGTTRMPVLFDFHGLGGDENQMQRLSGWAGKGDEEGFITVFPGGVDNAWNAGGCCSDTPTDVDFVREAIAYLDSEACIDKKRIYASGCSNGGAMSFRLACEAADVIAAVAPVDFDCVVGGRCGDCSPARPITEIQFRGTDDSAVPYSGAEPNFETWGEINQCSGSPEPLPENSSCQRQPMCADGVESILCTVQGGMHCGNYMSFNIADLAWEIISRYSLP